jgi:hypothetical protein
VIVANERREDSTRKNREMAVFLIMAAGPSGRLCHEEMIGP